MFDLKKSGAGECKNKPELLDGEASVKKFGAGERKIMNVIDKTKQQLLSKKVLVIVSEQTQQDPAKTSMITDKNWMVVYDIQGSLA